MLPSRIWPNCHFQIDYVSRISPGNKNSTPIYLTLSVYVWSWTGCEGCANIVGQRKKIIGSRKSVDMTSDEQQLKGWESTKRKNAEAEGFKGSDIGRDNCVSHESDRHRTDNFVRENHQISQNKSNMKFEAQVKWLDLGGILFVHLGALYGLYLLIFSRSLRNLLWVFISIYSSGFGITAGVHRLWSHRAYKAKWPLRFLLLILFTVSGQRDVYAWVLDHRVHHKYSETEADPHNAKRGFVFSHVGWLVLSPHPAVVQKRTQVDMSDLEADPLIMWQKKYYIPLFLVFAVAIPVLIPCYLWDERLWTSFWINFNFRYCVTLNIAFFVNSVAHIWGQRPYDKNISPTDNVSVSIAALGEGWHNYHHVFPYDYKTGELGDYTFNPTTGFIDFFARIGWAYDRKTVSSDMIRRRKERTGDGSNVWGWGDRDIPKEDYKELKNQR